MDMLRKDMRMGVVGGGTRAEASPRVGDAAAAPLWHGNVLVTLPPSGPRSARHGEHGDEGIPPSPVDQ